MTTAPRRRILIVTRNLPPLNGGMERLNWHMAQELARVFEVHVIGPAGAAALGPPDVDVHEVPLRPLWKFLLCARRAALRQARRWRPDLVLAGSGLTAPAARSAAKSCGAATAVYVHGLDVAVRHPVYRALWLPAIRGMDRVIANSHATARLCRDAGVAPARIRIVHPGVALPEPVHDSDAAADFRARHGLGDRPLLLSVGRLSARKGLLEFVEQALPRIVAVQPEVMLLAVGGVPENALHAASQTPDAIRAAAEKVGVAANLTLLGPVTDDRALSAIYRAANVHVFPVRDIPGDPEGFGMVAVEAAAHGLSTIAFATGGVVDAVAEGQSGRLVGSGDYAAFAAAVLQTLAEGGRLEASCRLFAQQFAWASMGQQLVRVLGLGAGVHADTGGTA